MKILINLLTIFFAFNLANAQSNPIALVTRLDGKAEVKMGNDGMPRPLEKNENLFARQQVRCDQAGGCRVLEISYCKNLPARKIKSNWSLIFYIPCNSNGGRITGEEKSDKDIIIYPGKSETLRRENFFVQWKPLESSIKLDLSLRIDLGEEIYSVKGIDGSKGVYQSADMLEKLKEAQMADAFSFNVILTGHGEDKTKIKALQSVTFMLLSLEKEKSLNEQLRLFEDETDEIFKLSGQALVFGEYRLYRESAREMEKILSLPQVLKMNKADGENLPKILTLAAMANYKALNTERTKKLCKKLADFGYPLPEFACSE